ncbi:peptidase inhibitor family I36 protein [Actinospica robiniae]|uniref:peptidase inhibitor family I36 protein n=1 Tax=Actinospica robiniae TaxID=304901 RepID=UPI0003F5D016|nr:peptidase inhibitor family I36 protein [Actinospica robiniae]
MKTAKVRLAAFGLAVAGTLSAAVVMASPSYAETIGANSCEGTGFNGYGEVGGCLFYNSNNDGAYFFFDKNIPDLVDYTFNHQGVPPAGLGQGVKNNAASAYNNSDACMEIFFNSNYKGASEILPPHTGTNKLGVTYNNDASVEFIAPIYCE